MSGLGKILLAVGAVILLVGAALIVAERLNLPIGRLPGDITYRSKNVTVFFPVVTCILLSAVISLVLWFVNRR